MYFNFYNGIELVKGKNSYLIIDIVNRKIYKIDKKFYIVLQKCQIGQNIENITNETNFLLKKLKELESFKIGYISDSFIKKHENKLPTNNLGMVWLNVTSDCNYRCIHCYENAGLINKKEKLNIEDYNKILNKLSKTFNINCVQITGGEPLLRGKSFISKLLKTIDKYNINTIELYSNLSLLDDEYIALFKKYKVCVATSLYSQYSKVHDSITQINGSYDLLMNNLLLLKQNNIPFRIGIIIMSQNESEKDSLRLWANTKFNLKEIKNYDIVRPVGRAKITSQFNQKLFEEKYYITNNKFLPYNYQSYMYNKVFNPCWGNKVCIKSDGSIYPCVMSNIKVGNYRNIIRCLSKKNSYRFLNKDKIKVCKNCEYRYLCTECRAIYAQSKKEIKNKPFVCMYNPKTNEYKEIKYNDKDK